MRDNKVEVQKGEKITEFPRTYRQMTYEERKQERQRELRESRDGRELKVHKPKQ